MNRAAAIIFGLGLALLLAAACLPWVAFDPLAERADRLQKVEALAADPSLPAFIRDELAARGIRPGLPPERLWALLGQNQFPANFDFVRAHERLFSWHLLALQTAAPVKLAVVGVYVAAALAAGLLIAVAAGVGGDRLGRAAAAAALLFGGALLLTLATTPLLDTFGHVGEWGPGWLDALSGARATLAPRALAPLALLLLAAGAALIGSLGQPRAAAGWNDEGDG